ncbi:MAG: class I SAM-dependent methyltransferase [Acidimicrobiales bacterium]
MADIEFREPGVVQVGKDRFSFAVPPPPASELDTPPVFKSRTLIEQLKAVIDDLSPSRIVEFGIYRGGSVALTAALTQPEKLVAIELAVAEQTALTDYLARSGFTETVRPYYGVDQSHPDVVEILRHEFGGPPIDLVIDDASHLYEPSRASLEMVFPWLRPGGVYIIEDWAAQHTLAMAIIDRIVRRAGNWEDATEQLASAVAPIDTELASELRRSPDRDCILRAARLASSTTTGPAMSRLGLELVHLAAESDDVVRRLEFTQGWIQITRGEGEISGPTWFADGSLDLLGSLAPLADDDT